MNHLSSPNFGPKQHKPVTKIAAVGLMLAAAGCSEPLPDPGTGLPQAGYTRQENGRTYVTTCFTESNAPGSVETIDLGLWSSFYAGRRHYSVSPRLIKEDLPTAERPQAFGTETAITLPQLIGKLTAGQLRLHPTPYSNSKVSLSCRDELKKVSNPGEFNDKLAQLDWTENNTHAMKIDGMTGPLTVDFEEGEDLDYIGNY